MFFSAKQVIRRNLRALRTSLVSSFVFLQLVDKEMFWVITEVVSEYNVAKRAKVIKQFIKVARKLFVRSTETKDLCFNDSKFHIFVQFFKERKVLIVSFYN